MKKNEFVLVYDSGIGGLTTLAQMMKTCPTLNYIYFADTKNCPYGNKCKSELNNLILSNIKSLQRKYTISHIVLACNTATTSSISHLREHLSIPIIGTEPNVMTPNRLGYKKILVLATPATAKTKKLCMLENKLTSTTHNIGIPSLAKLIEEYKVNDKKESLVKSHKIINKVLKNVDNTTAIVLGCTHYVYLKTYIENKGYKCYDGNTGVAKRLLSLTKDRSITKNSVKLIMITDSVRTNLIYKRILSIYKNKLQ